MLAQGMAALLVILPGNPGQIVQAKIIGATEPDVVAYIPGQPRVYTTGHKTREFKTLPNDRNYRTNHQPRQFSAENSSGRQFETVVTPRAFPTAAGTTPIYPPMTSERPKAFAPRPAREPFPTRQIDRTFPRLGKLGLLGTREDTTGSNPESTGLPNYSNDMQFTGMQSNPIPGVDYSAIDRQLIYNPTPSNLLPDVLNSKQ